MSGRWWEKPQSVQEQAEKHILHEAARDEVARLDSTMKELRTTVLDLCVENAKLRESIKIAAAELSSGIRSLKPVHKTDSMIKVRATLLAVLDHLH